ncbi:flagellin lysine-N-methylase [Massilia litorea]|uniref:Flagellin lysine-N-methylase n=1 Tax=Massilia litorea TaxID=2769491 RepID=A0A7L9U9N6_9BURK|nr:flagellin lysine-N-methylase [Massilia litorea]QOL51754.1 flagellin lysine-N-methylase [Massilia litorea]
MAILHPSKSLTALVPQYVSRFSCIGSSCEDSCCAGWRVNVDKKTFNAYRQSNHPELKPVFESSVRRVRSQESDASYARIELHQESAACPLMQDSLCSVQRHLNESYLSDTCFSYPRSTRQFAGGIEQSLTLSCPEAARQALLSPDAFDFVESKVVVRDTSAGKIQPMHGLRPETMNEIRIFCFQLMRTQGLEVWEKLAVLGVFCESLTKAIQAHKQQAVPALIEELVAALETGSITDALKDMPPNHYQQAAVFATMWNVRHKTTHSTSQNAILDMIARGMPTDPASGESVEQQIVANYRRGIERLPAALSEAPWLMEHYLLNEMFSALFPFGDSTPYEHYLRLVSRFGMVRFVLAAQCNSDASLPTPALLAQTVQVFCRRVQHDMKLAQQINQALQNTGWDRLDRIFGFLRS